MSADPDAAGVGFADALDLVDALLDEACEEHGMARAEAVVAGFSQGAGLAFALGLPTQRPAPPGGRARDEPVRAAGDGGRRLGRRDGRPDPRCNTARTTRWCRWRAAASSRRRCVEHGVPTVFSEYPMGHQVALESVQEGRAWLDAVRAGEKPARRSPNRRPKAR